MSQRQGEVVELQGVETETKAKRERLNWKKPETETRTKKTIELPGAEVRLETKRTIELEEAQSETKTRQTIELTGARSLRRGGGGP